jgi:hypothetical protein
MTKEYISVIDLQLSSYTFGAILFASVPSNHIRQ